MRRARLHRPAWPDVAELRLNALDLEADAGSSRKSEVNHPRRRLGPGLEGHGQQFQHLVRLAPIDILAAHALDALEMKPRAATLEAAVELRLPVEAGADQREAALRRQKGDIADTHQRVLQMRREKRKIVSIKRVQSQSGGHGETLKSCGPKGLCPSCCSFAGYGGAAEAIQP